MEWPGGFSIVQLPSREQQLLEIGGGGRRQRLLHVVRVQAVSMIRMQEHVSYCKDATAHAFVVAHKQASHKGTCQTQVPSTKRFVDVQRLVKPETNHLPMVTTDIMGGAVQSTSGLRIQFYSCCQVTVYSQTSMYC